MRVIESEAFARLLSWMGTLDTLGRKVKGSNPAASKRFFLEVSFEVYPFCVCDSIVQLFHASDVILVIIICCTYERCTWFRIQRVQGQAKSFLTNKLNRG